MVPSSTAFFVHWCLGDLHRGDHEFDDEAIVHYQEAAILDPDAPGAPLCPGARP